MKAAAYARYSTAQQTENSIEYQLAKIRAYCAEKEIEIVATYTDEARSGTNTDRPGFQAMLRAALRSEFDAVVIYDITRGSRDVGDWFNFRRAMMQAGVAVLSATQTLGDITDSNDFLLELISVGLGQREVLETRRKSMAGVDVKARTGVYMGGSVPLGYKIIRRQYVIEPAEAETVRAIFSDYADGMTLKGIMDKYRGRHGRAFPPGTVYQILNNERYIGVYTWNRVEHQRFRKYVYTKSSPRAIRIEGGCPAIVDRRTWDIVQKRLKDHKRNAANSAKELYILSGLVECESCGARYIGRTTRNGSGKMSRVYCCGKKYRGEKEHRCKNPNVPAEALEGFVVDQLRAYLESCDIDAEAERIASMVNAASADLSAEKRELAELNRKITNGYNAIMDGLTDPEFRRLLEELRDRKTELEELIARRESERPRVDVGQIKEILRVSTEDWETRKKQIIRDNIRKIYVRADGTISVHVGVCTDGCARAQHIVTTTIFDLRALQRPRT